MNDRPLKLAAIALLLVLAAGATTQLLASTGCLTSYEGCADCAQTMLARAMVRLDPSGIRQANFFLADCVIELYHCVLLGGHTTLACPV